MQPTTVKANFGYVFTLICLCLAAAAGCGVFIWVYKSMQILMAICGLFLLAGAVFLGFISRFFVNISAKELQVRAFTKATVAAEEIAYMEFSFFDDKNGVGYIYLQDHNSIVLPKKLFARGLKSALQAFAEAQGIPFKENAREEQIPRP